MTVMKSGQKNEITGLSIVNPSFNHDDLKAQYPNMQYNNYNKQANRSEIDTNSALNFQN